MISFGRTIAVAACLAAYCTSGFGQTLDQPVILIIEVDNQVLYRGDVTDAAKLARDPGVTTPEPSRAFQVSYNLSDIVAINGKPAKGRNSTLIETHVPRVNPQPGQVIANFDGGSPLRGDWQIQGPDGTWIGSLWDGGGLAAPGDVISAGHGAF
ncbi:MAG: hypothetical protein HY235_11950, partial [Acidobacteria bacterium]|nr:hypothetical protein [Acidobacteriota bacterium]